MESWISVSDKMGEETKAMGYGDGRYSIHGGRRTKRCWPSSRDAHHFRVKTIKCEVFYGKKPFRDQRCHLQSVVSILRLELLIVCIRSLTARK
jgi:hypothetical protein